MHYLILCLVIAWALILGGGALLHMPHDSRNLESFGIALLTLGIALAVMIAVARVLVEYLSDEREHDRDEDN